MSGRDQNFISGSRNSGEHVPVKRLVQAATPASGRPSRSPIKARPQEESSSSKLDVSSDKSSFLLLGQVRKQELLLLCLSSTSSLPVIPEEDTQCHQASHNLFNEHLLLSNLWTSVCVPAGGVQWTSGSRHTCCLQPVRHSGGLSRHRWCGEAVVAFTLPKVSHHHLCRARNQVAG